MTWPELKAGAFQIQVCIITAGVNPFGYLILPELISGYITTIEDEVTTFFRNVGIRPPNDAASRTRRTEPLPTPNRKPQNSQDVNRRVPDDATESRHCVPAINKRCATRRGSTA